MHIHCDVLVVGGGPAGSDGGARRRPPGARSSSPTSRPNSAARCCASRDTHRRQARRPTGSRDTVEELTRMPEVRLLPRTTAFGYYDHNYLVWRSAAPTTCRRRARPGRRASACGGSARSRSCSRPARTSARWCSPTTTGPASCWPPPRAPTQPLRRAAGQARRRLHQQRLRLRAALDLARAGVAVAAIVDLRTPARRSAGGRSRRRGIAHPDQLGRHRAPTAPSASPASRS